METQHQPEAVIAQPEAGKLNLENFDKQVKDALHLSLLDGDKVFALKDLVQKFDAQTDDPEISKQFEKNLEARIQQHAANLDRFRDQDSKLILEQAKAVEDLQNYILEMTQALPKGKWEQAKESAKSFYAKAETAVKTAMGIAKEEAKVAATGVVGEHGVGKGLADNAAKALKDRGNVNLNQ